MEKNVLPLANAPIVTGISPKEGPPGTKVIIRGENLGQNCSDLLSVFICDCDCTLLAEWKSPNKIIARSGPKKGKGDIIVKTKLGGVGTSTVQFRSYHETVGPTKESAVWVEESPVHTLSWCRRSLSPTSYQQEDPLGLSVEGNETKMPEYDLNDIFVNESGDLASKNFNPCCFLLECHHATNFDDLKAGLSYLKRKVDSQKEGQLSFLKSNVGSVINQLDMLAKLKDKLEIDLIGLDAFTGKLELKIQISKEDAHDLFQEVLARKERADATRNALIVLSRFKFLFCLPSVMERNILKKDYDVVINDYARVKNLFSDKEVPIFKKVLIEIESKISEARMALIKMLKKVPPSFEEFIKLIKNLINLETPNDPAWMGVECYANYLILTMNDLKDKYIVLDSSENTKKNKQSSKSYCIDSLGMKPYRVFFVEELIDLMEIKFPDLWKLGQMYFASELYGISDSEKHTSYKNIVVNVMENFCQLLRAAILPHTLQKNNQFRQNFGIWSTGSMETIYLWLPYCLRYAHVCYNNFFRIDLPSKVLNIFSTFLFDLQFHCITTIFKQAANDIICLYEVENWSINIHETFGTITNIPKKFQIKFCEVIQLIHDICHYKEIKNAEKCNNKKEIFVMIHQLFLNFGQILEKLVFDIGDEHSEMPNILSQLIFTADVNRVSPFGTVIWEQHLLAVICNCQYTANVVVPQLFVLIKSEGYPVTNEFISDCQNIFTSLSSKILDRYNEQKCDPLVGTIEPSMYISKFDWDTDFEPIDVRPYVKEIIMNLVGVRSELYKVPLDIVKQIMSKIVETIAEELARLMSCTKGFSFFGSVQARADILAIKDGTKFYITNKGLRFYEEALNSISILNEEGLILVTDILDKFRCEMSLHLSSLNDSITINY